MCVEESGDKARVRELMFSVLTLCPNASLILPLCVIDSSRLSSGKPSLTEFSSRYSCLMVRATQLSFKLAVFLACA